MIGGGTVMNEYLKHERSVVETNHMLTINNRKTIDVHGVKDVDSFDHEEFLLETNMGYLIIRGDGLQLKNLDVKEGKVSIEGKVYELSYIDEAQQEVAKGFFSKLFK